MDKIKKAELIFTNMEPVNKSRFLLSIGDIPSYLIYSISDLHCNIDGFNKKEWDDIYIKIYDTVDLPIAKIIMDETNKCKSDISMILLDPAGQIVSTYKLLDAHIYDVNLGSFDWNSIKPNIISMHIEFSDIEIVTVKNKEI